MSCYPLQSNVLHVRRSFSSDFGNVQKSATIWGLDIFTQNPKTFCCFPQIFSKLWSGLPNVRQLIAIWSPTVPKFARHLVAKCSFNHLKTITLMIAEFANYSFHFLFRKLFRNWVWWANGACGDYYVNIQRTFSEKITKCSQNMLQLFASSLFAAMKISGSPNSRRNFEHFQNFGRTLRERSVNMENVWRKRRKFGEDFGNFSNLAFTNIAIPVRTLLYVSHQLLASYKYTIDSTFCVCWIGYTFSLFSPNPRRFFVAKYSPTSPIDCRLLRLLPYGSVRNEGTSTYCRIYNNWTCDYIITRIYAVQLIVLSFILSRWCLTITVLCSLHA